MNAPVPQNPLGDTLNRIALQWGDDHFDEAAGLVLFEHPKSIHMSGGAAHLLRESCFYAFSLLRRGNEEDIPRAARILELTLPKQNLDQDSPYWAGFTCEFEQDWATWPRPDENWVQFLGMIFAYILQLDRETPCLYYNLRQRLTEAFRLTVLATIRRNVGPDYTNIALLSAAVAAAGATLLQMENAEAFALEKLSQVLTRVQPSGCFEEYLSPTYYGASLFALYSVEAFADTACIQKAANQLIELMWNDIDRAYHPATGQLGGPQARAYGDDLHQYAAYLKYYLYLALNGEYPLNEVESHHSHDCSPLGIVSTHVVHHRLTTERTGERFSRIALPVVSWESPKVLCQYQSEVLSFGTVNDQNDFGQRRNLLAYWVVKETGVTGVCKGHYYSQHDCLRSSVFFSNQHNRGALICLRLPVEAASDAAFVYRLDFNLLGEVDKNAEQGNRIHLQLPSLDVDLQPINLAMAGDNAVLAVTSYPDWPTGIEWRWGKPAQGQSFYWAAFAVFLTPTGAAPVEIDDITIKKEDGATTLSATIDGEPLSLIVPPIS